MSFRYMFSENCSVLSLSPLQKRRLDILLVYQKLYIYHCRVLEKRLIDRISSNNSRGRLFLFSHQKGAIIRGKAIIRGRRLF